MARRKAAAKPKKPKPGVYESVPFAEYASWPYVNNSALRWAAKSAAHYRWFLDSKYREDSPAMKFGRLVHAIAANDLDGIVVFDGPEWIDLKARYSRPTSTKEWEYRVRKLREHWRDKHSKSVEVYTGDEWESATAVWDSICKCEAAAWIFTADKRELSIVWDCPNTKIRCKARLDVLGSAWIGDLKTTQDASSFEYSIESFGYHRQMAFYRQGWSQLTGEIMPVYLVAAETRAPYGCRAARVGERFMERGLEQLGVAMERIGKACDSGEWNGYTSPKEWDIPSRDSVTVWIDGKEETW